MSITWDDEAASPAAPTVKWDAAPAQSSPSPSPQVKWDAPATPGVKWDEPKAEPSDPGIASYAGKKAWELPAKIIADTAAAPIAIPQNIANQVLPTQHVAQASEMPWPLNKVADYISPSTPETKATIEGYNASPVIRADPAKDIRQAVMNKIGPGEIAPPQGIVEHGIDLAANLAGTAADIGIAHKALPASLQGQGPITEAAAWEAQNQASGGTPGVGAAMGGTVGAIGKALPAAPVRAAVAEGLLFGASSYVATGKLSDALVNALLPAAVKGSSHAFGYVTGRLASAKTPEARHEAIQELQSEAAQTPQDAPPAAPLPPGSTQTPPTPSDVGPGAERAIAGGETPSGQAAVASSPALSGQTVESSNTAESLRGGAAVDMGRIESRPANPETSSPPAGSSPISSKDSPASAGSPALPSPERTPSTTPNATGGNEIREADLPKNHLARALHAEAQRTGFKVAPGAEHPYKLMESGFFGREERPEYRLASIIRGLQGDPNITPYPEDYGEGMYLIRMREAQKAPDRTRPIVVANALHNLAKGIKEPGTYFEPLPISKDYDSIGESVPNDVRAEHSDYIDKVSTKLIQNLAKDTVHGRIAELNSIADFVNPQSHDPSAGGEYGTAVTAATIKEAAKKILRDPTIFERAYSAEKERLRPKTTDQPSPPPDPLFDSFNQPAPAPPKSVEPNGPGDPTKAGDIGVGPAGINDPAFTKPNEGPTSIKNSVVDRERASRGLPAAMSVAKQGFGEVWDSATKEIDRDPAAGDKLVQELNQKARPVSATEDAILLHRQVELQNEYHKVTEDLIKASEADDRPAMLENRMRWSALSDQLLEVYNASKSAGTETGRGLNARRMMANEDYSLAGMETAKRASKNGEPLTQAEHAKIKELNDKLAASQKAFEKYQKEAEEKIRDLQSKQTIVKMKADAAKDAASGKPKDLNKQRDNILSGMKDRVAGGAKAKDLGNWIQRLARNFVAQGINERDPLAAAVHGAIKDVIPGITKRETMDAISGYGDFRQLSKDQVSVQLRDLKGQMQQVAKLEDMLQKQKAPLKTGVERRIPSDEERRLIQQVNEAKKKLNIQTTDPATQLKSALDGIKTRLNNQINDLSFQIATKEKIVRQKGQAPTDAEADALRSYRDTLKKQYDEIFPANRQLTDAQRVKMAMDAVQRSIADYDQRIKTGNLYEAKRETPTTPELEAARTKRDSLKEELNLLKSLDTPTIESAKELGLQKSIAALDERIKSGDVATKSETPTVDSARVASLKLQLKDRQNELQALRNNPQAEQAAKAADLQRIVEGLQKRIAAGDISTRAGKPTVDNKEVTELKAQRDALSKQLQQMRNDAIPKKSSDEIALQAFKTRTSREIAQRAQRIADEDFSPTPKRTPIALDKEGLRLNAENERLKQIFQQDLTRSRLKNRTTAEKAQDFWVKWRRASILSSPVTLAKLTSAAAERMVTTPLEEGIGAGIGKVIPRLAERAPTEAGFSIKQEAKAAVEGMKQGMSDAGRILKTGKSDLDVVYGRDSGIPHGALDFVGSIHSALKTAPKRAAFTRAAERGMEWAMRNGMDTTDPIVQSRVMVDAYKSANRSIFMQDNYLSNKLSMFFAAKAKAGEAHPSAGAKAWETIGKTFIPITKVPTNIVAETMDYALGSVTGGVKLANAYRKGIEKLPPEQADIIMRSLKKGSVGAAVMALGFFNSRSLGGYYQPGKRNDEDVKFGAVRIFGVDVPSYLVHNPLLECLQIGATVARVADSKLRKSDPDTQGVGAGAVAAALGVIDEVPFVRETTEVADVLDPRTRQSAIGQTAKSLIVPQGVQWAAQQFDSVEKRKPQSITQNVEMGIPGLRNTVPDGAKPVKIK